jgi:uncharacterized protein YecE (DUF72 family)
MAEVFVGTSGWNYKHWRGLFYPRELKTAEWLHHFAAHFRTVEINNSFYRLPTEHAFRTWREAVPRGFVFAVKASRYLTHIKRLRDPDDPLDLFLSRAKHLRGTLGPVLFQLPPRFKCDPDRLAVFLRSLRAHPLGKKRRAVLEVRDSTWLTRNVFQLLERFNICLCLADWHDLPIDSPLTADFVYVRRHYGKSAGGNYSHPELNKDIRQIRRWSEEGRDVYIYFNNDWNGYAVKNALYVQKAVVSKTKGNAFPL